jgi:mRNA interferase RelE/StbE
VTRPIVWSERALNTAAGFLGDDPQGLRQLLDAVDRLADDAQPASSVQYGSSALRRLRVGRYRVLYEISDVITVIHVGRLG